MSTERTPQLLAVLVVGVIIGAVVSAALMRPEGPAADPDPNRGTPAHQGVDDPFERLREMVEEKAREGMEAGQPPAASAPGNAPDPVPSPPPEAALPRNVPPEHWAMLGGEHREWLIRIAADLRTRDPEDTVLRVGDLARVGALRLPDATLLRRSQISGQLLRLLSPEDCAFVITDAAFVHSLEALGVPMDHPAMVELLHMTVEAAWLEHTRSAPAIRLDDQTFMATVERYFAAVGPEIAAAVDPILTNPSAFPAAQVCDVGLTFFDQAERLPPPWGARLARAMIPE